MDQIGQVGRSGHTMSATATPGTMQDPLPTASRLPSTSAARDEPATGPYSSYPPFAAPGLVLLAAAAIFEGYYWLHLIPGGSLRPSGLLFAVLALPATVGLVRQVDRRAGPVAELAARCARLSAAVPVLGVLVVVTPAVLWSRCLGAVAVGLAVSALVLVGSSEHRDRTRSD